jgi:predicted KAP-like P-loop ATPase
LDPIIERINGIEFDQSRWANLFLGALASFFDNLRNVNRFLATLSVHVGLFTGPRAFEVNVVDLIAIEVLRVFEPDFYSSIATSKEILTRGVRREARGSIPSEIQTLIDSATAPHRGATQEILKQLFPPIEAAFGGFEYSPGSRETWRNQLRVCSPEMFDRYFQFGVPSDDLSESEFKEILEFANDQDAFVARMADVRSRELLNATLDRLDAYAPSLERQVARPFINALLCLAEDLPDREGFFEIGPDLRLLRIVARFLGQNPDIRTRGQLFLEIMDTSGLIVLPTYLIANDDNMRQSKPNNTDGIRIFEDDQLQRAKEKWLEKVHMSAETDPDKFLTNPKLPFILYRWREWEEGGPAAYLQRVINSQSRALIFLTSLAQQGQSYQSGDFTAKTHTYIRLHFIEDFMPLESFSAYLKPDTIGDSQLTKEQTAALAAFKYARQRRAEGKPDGSFGSQ